MTKASLNGTQHGNRLTAARTQRGWSKAKLARRARLTQATLSQIEAGLYHPEPVEIARLATALEVPADRLLKPRCRRCLGFHD